MDAYDFGYEAYNDGDECKPEQHYPNDPSQWDKWERGWCDARDAAMKRMKSNDAGTIETTERD